jgi:hypothetical protein
MYTGGHPTTMAQHEDTFIRRTRSPAMAVLRLLTDRG